MQFLRELPRTSTQIIKRKRIRELAHKVARADCSVANHRKGIKAHRALGTTVPSHIGVSRIYNTASLVEFEGNLRNVIFERVATYFYPKLYYHTASLVEYGGNLQKFYLPSPLRVRAILFFFRSTSLISTSITSPTEKRSEGRLTNLSDISEM